jgi:acyl-CoA synthetase (NDP forming)
MEQLDSLFHPQSLAVAADPGIDVVVVVGAGMTPESNQLYTESMIQTHKDYQKPFLIVSIPGFDPNLAQQFCQAGIPFFESAERAMRTYSQVRQYHRWRQERGDS